MTAKDMERGKLYRRTRDAWPGTHWEIPSISREKMLDRLSGKPTMGLTTDEWCLLRDLRKGNVLVWTVTRFRGSDGQVIKRKRYSAINPETKVRVIKNPPALG